ncbi:alpha-amylase/4-alpha-glucanotransferase domain-containing protein, partial [Myxococcota bacterium]
YGGPPNLLPEVDVRGQIQMTAEFWESFAGVSPQGFWLPGLAWAPELPRFIEDTGLSYGFVSSSQVAGSNPPPMGVVERGGASLVTYVLSAGLSGSLPFVSSDEWATATADATAGLSEPMVTIWVRAESLGLEPGTRACLEHGWLDQWLTLLGERSDFETALPSATMASARNVGPVKIRPGIAPDLMASGARPGPVDWTDFVSDFAEVDTIYRRMLRSSEKLRLLIAHMEEEGLEDAWSDALATAQRQVFSAQSLDAYWRGLEPGFSDPALRDAMIERVVDAESSMDALVQGDDDWIATEEEDRDGDLVEEVFVANRLLGVWIVPARGGAIRTLDDKRTSRNVLDAGIRRKEDFFAEMAQAEQVEAGTERELPPRRGAGVVRLASELPTVVDAVERVGACEWLLDPDATATEFFSGSLDRSPQERPQAEILEHQIDEEGDGTYTFGIRNTLRLGGVRARDAVVEKTIAIPIDAAELTMSYSATVQGQGGALLAVELPFRLGVGESKVLLGGEVIEARETECPDVKNIRVEGSDGTAVDLDIEPALDVWLLPVRTTVRDLDGYRPVEHGMVVVPIIRVEDQARAVIKLKLDPGQSFVRNVEPESIEVEVDLDESKSE